MKSNFKPDKLLGWVQSTDISCRIVVEIDLKLWQIRCLAWYSFFGHWFYSLLKTHVSKVTGEHYFTLQSTVFTICCLFV